MDPVSTYARALKGLQALFATASASVRYKQDQHRRTVVDTLVRLDVFMVGGKGGHLLSQNRKYVSLLDRVVRGQVCWV